MAKGVIFSPIKVDSGTPWVVFRRIILQLERYNGEIYHTFNYYVTFFSSNLLLPC